MSGGQASLGWGLRRRDQSAAGGAGGCSEFSSGCAHFSSFPLASSTCLALSPLCVGRASPSARPRGSALLGARGCERGVEQSDRGDVVTCSRRNGEWNVSLCSAVTSARARRKRAGMTCVRESELFGRGAMLCSDFCEFPCETQTRSRSGDYSPVCGYWSVTDCECSGTGSCKLARLNCVSLIVGSECGSVWIRVIWGVLGWSWGDTFTCFYLQTLHVEWAEGVRQFLKDPRVQAESDSSFTLVKLGLGCFSFCALCCYRRYCVTFMALQGIGTTRSKVQVWSVSVSCCGLGVTGFLLGSAQSRSDRLIPFLFQCSAFSPHGD